MEEKEQAGGQTLTLAWNSIDKHFPLIQERQKPAQPGLGATTGHFLQCPRDFRDHVLEKKKIRFHNYRTQACSGGTSKDSWCLSLFHAPQQRKRSGSTFVAAVQWWGCRHLSAAGLAPAPCHSHRSLLHSANYTSVLGSCRLHKE